MPRAVTGKELGPVLGMYSHGMVAPAGEIVVVAGQVGADASGRSVGPGDVGAQTRQALANVDAVLRAAGASMRDVVRFQTFLTHASDIDGFMQARREVFPTYFPDGVYPPNTLLIISRLVQPELLVEIEAMAVKPARGAPSAASKAPRSGRQPGERRGSARSTARRTGAGRAGSRGPAGRKGR
jgi:enamine deaminase RidA (YjgF/YER057c/UK114 family)